MKFYICEKCPGDKFCLFATSDELTKPPSTCLTEKNEGTVGLSPQYEETEDVEFFLKADSDRPFCLGPG